MDKLHAYRQQVVLAIAQIVKDGGFVPLFGLRSRNGTTDIPSAATSEDLHKKDCLFESVWSTLSL